MLGETDIAVTPAVLSELLKCSRHKAYRRLVALEKVHPEVVRRGRGRTIYAMASDLRAYVKELRRESPSDRELRQVRSELQELESRMDAEVRANLEFRRKAHEWFERIRALEARQRASA